MRCIAHRVLKDGSPLAALDDPALDGFDGVELDLRLCRDGALTVRHSPLFGGKRGFMRGAGAPFGAVFDKLAARRPRPRTLLLDVKSPDAARAAAAWLRDAPPVFELVFACWRAEEAAAIREHLPTARILYCVAPIVSGRPKARCGDYYVANSFPFVWSARRFSPRRDKHNRHNINVKVLRPGREGFGAPEGVDGVCLHRVFWRPELAEIAASEGLHVALYGLSSRAQAVDEAVLGRFDLAIIGAKPRRERRDAPRAEDARSRPIAA